MVFLSFPHWSASSMTSLFVATFLEMFGFSTAEERANLSLVFSVAFFAVHGSLF